MRSQKQRPGTQNLRSHAQWNSVCHRTCSVLPGRKLSNRRGVFAFFFGNFAYHNVDRGTQGLVIPEALRPYMQGREFLPWVKELPKGLQKKQA